MENTFPNTQPSKLSIAIFLLVVLLLIVAGFGVLSAVRVKDDVTAGAYTAVFFSNNSVYFGKVTDTNQTYVILRNVHYLRPAPATNTSDSETNTNSSSSGLALVRLDSELQGPLDEMRINRDHILFMEELRADSQVVKAIEAQK